MTLLAYAVTLTAIGWTQWVRRATWRNPWESPTTAASLMLGIADTGTYPDVMLLHDGAKQLDAVLGYLVGRRLSTREICAALELSRST